LLISELNGNILYNIIELILIKLFMITFCIWMTMRK